LIGRTEGARALCQNSVKTKGDGYEVGGVVIKGGFFVHNDNIKTGQKGTILVYPHKNFSELFLFVEVFLSALS